MATNSERLCRLCGDYKKMSFEHIPPKKAFNNNQQLLRTMENHFSGNSCSKFPRGLGRYSLCVDCNNRTGALYAKAFINWTKQGFDFLDMVGEEKLLSLPYYIQPLNVIKQIMTMAIGMSDEMSIDANKEIRQFIVNRRQNDLPPSYRVFVYYSVKGQIRFSSGMAILDINGGGSDHVLAEVALPPFGYAITKPVGNRKSLAESKGLYEITWFSKFRFNEWTQVHLRIPTRETNFPSPLDYRNKYGIE